MLMIYVISALASHVVGCRFMPQEGHSENHH